MLYIVCIRICRFKDNAVSIIPGEYIIRIYFSGIGTTFRGCYVPRIGVYIWNIRYSNKISSNTIYIMIIDCTFFYRGNLIHDITISVNKTIFVFLRNVCRYQSLGRPRNRGKRRSCIILRNNFKSIILFIHHDNGIVTCFAEWAILGDGTIQNRLVILHL